MSIPPVVIYAQNEGQMSSDLSPPLRRLPKWLAWLLCLFNPIQWDHDLLFTNGYSDGSSAANWVSGNTYAYAARVVDVDYQVYECKNLTGVTSTTNPHLDAANWFKVLDTFIGSRERSYYNGNLLMLEYILNRYFQVGSIVLPWSGPIKSGANKQIYLVNTNNAVSNFWLSNGSAGALTSFMPNKSNFSQNYLGNAYNAFSKYGFDIYCPSAIATAIGNNQPAGAGAQFSNGQSTSGFTTAQVAAGNVIMAVTAKYAQANRLYNFILY